jgi:cellulose synthase (UDP-forming)
LEETLAPSIAVLAIWAVASLLVPRKSRAAPWIVAAIAFLTLLYYLPWRVMETVLPADPLSGAGFYVWAVFAIETVYILDFIKIVVLHLRRVDRRDEADTHQARLEARPPETWPSVDVLIPTYNEPLDVLERTIVGALALDYPRFNVWVLDDGDRAWLRDFCAEKGAGYICRPEHTHAKAGNMNHALGQTKGDLVAILDADFVPLQWFLKRTVGFFDDPSIGIVQTPQHFFNRDPVQMNLGLSDQWPDEQRLFFDKMAPSLDAWDSMFCCGSCSVLRRRAIEAIGGIPTVSITEDILTTLTMFRHGYITRYLNERLTVGLAAESLEAFYVQRQRWCQGGIQCLFTEMGPLGPGIDFAKRVFMFPIYWLFHIPARLFLLLIPVLYFWFGLEPLYQARSSELLFWQVPFILSSYAIALWYYGRQATPLVHDGPATLVSINLLPTVVSSLIKPFGKPFKVTPKGSSAGRSGAARYDLFVVVALLAATIGGMYVNIPSDSRIVQDDSLLGVSYLWSTFNALALIIAGLMCLEQPAVRSQERFPVDIRAQLWVHGSCLPVRLRDLSLTGASIVKPNEKDIAFKPGDAVTLELDQAGPLRAEVARVFRRRVGLRLTPLEGEQRDAMIRYLYTSGIENAPKAGDIWEVAKSLYERFTE